MPGRGESCTIAVIDGGIEVPEARIDAELEISSIGVKDGFDQRNREKIIKMVGILSSLGVGIVISATGGLWPKCPQRGWDYLFQEIRQG